MKNEQDTIRPRGKAHLKGEGGQATEFEELVGRSPQFRGLAKVEAGEEEGLTPSQREFLDEFKVGLMKRLEESGNPTDG